MLNRVTIKDVAVKAGVSIATVSRALNDNYPVSYEIKAHVLEVAKDMGYVPNSIARSLKIQSTHSIGFMVADISNPYHISVAKAVEDVIQRHNYSMIICSTENNRLRELTYLKLLMSKNIDGLILNPSGKNDDFVMKMNKQMPIVLINRRLSQPDFIGDLCDGNSFLGCHILTKHLLTLGHKKIYAVSGPRYLSNSKERFNGFKAAMKESGIIVDKSYPWFFEGNFSIESGVRSIDHLCSLTDRPTAIISMSNMMTVGILRALREKNIRAPEDVSIVAYDGIDNLDLISTRPTVANIDTIAIGRKVGEAILERIHQEGIENREFIFQPEIIPGNAVGIPTDNLSKRVF